MLNEFSIRHKINKISSGFPEKSSFKIHKREEKLFIRKEASQFLPLSFLLTNMKLKIAIGLENHYLRQKGK